MSVILVTGASRGIGAVLADNLASLGHTVFAGIRTPQTNWELRETRGDIRPLELDVTEPAQIREAITKIVFDEGGLDVLINNAGVGWFAPAEEMSELVLRTTMETNFFGAVRCTQEVLPLMRRSGSGQIIMISSLAAARGLPLESAYCASKSALEAYAESVRYEARRFGINVSVIEPGITDGGLSTSIPDPQARSTSAYQPLIDHTFQYYEAAQAQRESAELVVDCVSSILKGQSSEFRYRLGKLAPVIESAVRAPDGEAESIVRAALEVDWWIDGRTPPISNPNGDVDRERYSR